MDDLILEHKGMTNVTEILKRPIVDIQKILQKQNDEEKVTVDTLEEYVECEKKMKNRRSLLRWLNYGIKLGELPSEYFLDFMAEVGIWKSAMQKYIRRGDVEKAVRAAAKLNEMQPASLIRRLKVILCEDCYTSIDLYTLVDINPITVAGYAAERGKDGHCCRAFNEIKDTEEYKKGYDLEWLKDNYKEGDFAKVVSMLFALREDNKLFEVEKIFKNDLDLMPTKAGTFIMKELLSSSKVDYDLTLVALLKMIRDGYEVIAEKVTHSRFNKIVKKQKVMKIQEVDWYAFDFHTFPGRVARDLAAKDLGLERSALGWMWWFGESSFRVDEAEPADDYKPYYMTEKEKQCIKDWEEVKETVQKKVEYVAKELFKLDALNLEDVES